MTIVLAAMPAWKEVAECPALWGILASGLGLWLLLPNRLPYARGIGSLLLVVGAMLFGFDLPRLGAWSDQIVFWLMAAITLGSAVLTIASRSAVYSALWFALSLIGTSGLFLFQGAQFLGVATIVVYAGAIVVTFLFVIMLAQPEGHSTYDRISWGWFAKTFSVLAAGGFVGILTLLAGDLKLAAEKPIASSSTQQIATPGKVLNEHHMASLGEVLFSHHLIAVEVAGTLLLVALVGAIAIAMYGKPKLATQIEEALR